MLVTIEKDKIGRDQEPWAEGARELRKDATDIAVAEVRRVSGSQKGKAYGDQRQRGESQQDGHPPPGRNPPPQEPAKQPPCFGRPLLPNRHEEGSPHRRQW